MLVVYDISEQNGGAARMRNVVKVCKNHGQRVQDSVFECMLDWAGLVEMKAALEKVVDKKLDTVRIYNLGKSLGKNHLIVIGKDNKSYDPEKIIIV